MTETVRSFFDQLDAVVTEKFELITENHCSRSYIEPLNNIQFKIELSEARVRSSFGKSDDDNIRWWSDLLYLSLVEADQTPEIELKLWDSSKHKIDPKDKEPESVTEIEFSSGLFDIGDRKELDRNTDVCLRAGMNLVDRVTTDLSKIEGKERTNLVKSYERSRSLRDIAVAIHGLRCTVCDFDFEEKYGDIGQNFIHIHHLDRISDAGVRAIDPRTDLVPVCPNCHSMLHKEVPPLTPQELREQIKGS